MKKLVALLACFYLAAHLTGCTSKDSKEESDSPVAEESTENVNGELEKVEGAEANQATASSGGADTGFLDEQLPEDALGEKKAPETAATDAAPAPVDTAANTSQEPSLDMGSPSSSPAPTDVATAPPVDSGATVAGVDPGSAPTDSAADTGAKKSGGSSYQKAKTAPFTQGGQLLNAVYVARPKDNFKSVAKMIYGDEGKQKDLKKANPGLSKLRVGDKVYYNSPQRPTDDQKLASYYEDNGMMPESYIAQDGDDLKKVSKKLLGFDNAWKEMFALNAVESKGSLPAGTELKYWKKPASMDTAAPTTVAMNDTHSTFGDKMPPPSETHAATTAASDLPPPPPPPADIPPPPPVEAQAPPPPPAMEPPPPPPVEAQAPPPPPPPTKKPTAKESIAAEEGAMDNDTMMALGGGGIVLVGLVAIMILRKRKQAKEMAAAFNDTQVGT